MMKNSGEYMQVIKFKWQDRSPMLMTRNGDDISALDLMNNEINWDIGKKYCLGFFRGSKHFPCKSRREAEEGQCNECKLEDEYFFCIRCNGEQCINRKKRGECERNFYYVYLAAFDSMLKVGISYEYRIRERLIEQGADFAAKIARVKDGKTVREIEQKIKRELKVTDKITGQQKSSLIFGNPNVSMANIFRAITLLKNNGLSRHLINPEIYDLREYYNLHNVLEQPRQIEVEDGINISGKVVSTKGNIIILRNNKGFFSVNAHRLLGREILNMAQKTS